MKRKKLRPIKRKKLRPIKRIKDDIWKLFSEWIRRSEDGVCFTCGNKKHWKLQQAGHYIHKKLDFDPFNVHCQCIACNHFKSGNLGIYAEKLIYKYGIDIVDDLRRRAKEIWKPARTELAELKRFWQSELERLDVKKS